MSKVKIERELKNKGIIAESIEWQSSCPVPEGITSGWDLEFSEDTEDLVWEADPTCDFSTYEEFHSLGDVLSWINKLPVINKGV